MAPSFGTDSWTMDCAGSLSGGTPGNDLFPGDHFLGQFTINGQPFAAVNFSPHLSANFADPKLSISALTICPARPGILEGTGSLVVEAFGILDISAGAVAGLHSGATITLTAAYFPTDIHIATQFVVSCYAETLSDHSP